MSKGKTKAEILSLFDLMEIYKTEEDGIKYLEQMRWGDKPYCVKCGCSGRLTPQKKQGHYWCGDCRGYFNYLTDTPLEHSRVKDVRKWIYASYLLLTSRKGISAMQLSKEVRVSYPTAWYMLHRLRTACGTDMKALKGEVEVDEVYLGGKEANKHQRKKLKAGRGTVGKQGVLGMRERGGRVKAMPIEENNSETLMKEIYSNVDLDSIIYTDDHRGYAGLSENGFAHKTVKHSAKEFVNGMASTNSIESVWAVLKRGYNGVYHNWSNKHCRKYIDEFTFRLNEGNCNRNTQDRLNSLFRNMSGKSVSWKELVANE